MKSLPTLKDIPHERRVFEARIWISCGAMALMALLLLGRLFYLQVVNHEHYSTLSAENRLKVVPLAPPRGLIFSRDGAVLAENRPSFDLVVTPEKATDLERAVSDLSALLNLGDENFERFNRALRSSRRFENVTVKSDLSPDNLAVFSVNRHRFPGFAIQAGLTRHYPLADVAAHLTGYVARISDTDLAEIDEVNYSATSNIGKTGVEKAREDLLHGTVGYQTVEVNAQGRVLRIVEKTPPVAGADLFLTIDAALQQEAVTALGDYSGAVVALDPNTGSLLVLASTPAYDPNKFVTGIGRKLYRELSTSNKRPLFSRALQGQYPPGSTIKPILALAALEHKVRTSDDRTWCPGWYSLPGQEHRYRDWLKRGHGHVDLKLSIAHSCDVYFYKLAKDLGIQRLGNVLRRFGFGDATGIDIPGEVSGLVPSPKWKRRNRKLPWYPGETLLAGIGQGFMLATPLQLAQMTAIVAARGQSYAPHLLEQIEYQARTEHLDPKTFQRNSVKLDETSNWDVIVESMVEVVHGPTGTARGSGHNAPVRFAGKTGTAQVFGVDQDIDIKDREVPEHLRDHALFVAFAPADNPEIAIAVIVEHGGGGSRVAAPIARRLIDKYFGNEPLAGSQVTGGHRG
ncbi:MAG: penicillin-binding protein 2 [Gammaproteobacteria bacterium]